MSASRRPLFALVVLALAAALLPTISASGSRTYATKVIFSSELPLFHGRLESGYGVCIADRTVKLFRERPGPDDLIGLDERSGFYHGKWLISIGKGATTGTYYAVATVQGDCLPAKSRRFRVER